MHKMDGECTDNTTNRECFDNTVNGVSSPEAKLYPHPIALVSPSSQSFLFQPRMLPFPAGQQVYSSIAAPCLTQASVFYSSHYIPPSHLGIAPAGTYAGNVPPLMQMQANASRPSVVQLPQRKRKSSNDSEHSEAEISSRLSKSSVGSLEDVVKAEEVQMEFSDTSLQPSPVPKKPNSPPSPSSGYSTQVVDTCGICGDKATGHHYGVASCEGCKGFFKRSVQNKKVYTCRNLTKDCPVDKRHRNRCQYCRFQKCLVAGMIKEAVREDRAPGGRHKNSFNSSTISKTESVACKPQTKSSSSSTASEPSKPPVSKPLPEVIKQVINCDSTNKFDEETCMGCKETEVKAKTLAHITQLAEFQVIRSAKWFEQLQLLHDISLADRELLIKNSWVELMLANLIKESQYLDNRAMLCKKQILDIETAQTTGIADIMQRVTQMAANFREFNMDNVEFVCMKIIVLLNPDVVGLENQNLIEELQDTIHTALQHYIRSKSLKDTNRFGNILLRLPELRSIGTKSIERLFMLKFTGQIHPSEVLSELLHSAKR